MKLYQVDYLLIHGRYSIATADIDTSLNHYIEAKQLAQETGYLLRDAELDLFAAQICHQSSDKHRSTNLQKVRKRIEEIRQWPRWKKIAKLVANNPDGYFKRLPGNQALNLLNGNPSTNKAPCPLSTSSILPP